MRAAIQPTVADRSHSSCTEVCSSSSVHLVSMLCLYLLLRPLCLQLQMRWASPPVGLQIWEIKNELTVIWMQLCWTWSFPCSVSRLQLLPRPAVVDWLFSVCAGKCGRAVYGGVCCCIRGNSIQKNGTAVRPLNVNHWHCPHFIVTCLMYIPFP